MAVSPVRKQSNQAELFRQDWEWGQQLRLYIGAKADDDDIVS